MSWQSCSQLWPRPLDRLFTRPAHWTIISWGTVRASYRGSRLPRRSSFPAVTIWSKLTHRLFSMMTLVEEQGKEE
jgi:hypothetical protein